MKGNDHDLPTRFGQFYLFDLIGEGGMAEIFLAKTFTGLGTDRLCVIKRILPHLNADEEFCEMLVQEAKLCSYLSHASVVQTYDLGHVDGQYYIAMEYVEGLDLNKLLGHLSRTGTSLPLQFAVYVIEETLKALDYAHRLTGPDGGPLGIIHRDVSPTNVLISTEGEVKLCDFGIAKAAFGDMGSDRMDEYHLKGKVAYMSPEHVAGDPIDHRADLFAAGILLWELLSGRRLYKTGDEQETFRRAREAEIPPLADRGFPEFETLSSIVSKALERDPDARFRTGQELLSALEDYRHDAGLIISQLRFSEFLMEEFGEELQRQRRERERHLSDLIAAGEEPGEVEVPEATPAGGEAAEGEAAEKGAAEEEAPDDIEGARTTRSGQPPTGSVRIGSTERAPERASAGIAWAVGIALAAAAAAAAYLLLGAGC